MNATLGPPLFERKAVAPPGAVSAPKPPSMLDDAIRRLAYRKWEAAGRPACDGVKYWLEAEQEILVAK